MKEIILNVPDEFTPEQEQSIKQTAIFQIESELRKTLKIPQADIDAVEDKITQLRTAQGIPVNPKS